MKKRFLRLTIMLVLMAVMIAGACLVSSAAENSDYGIATASVNVSGYGAPVASWDVSAVSSAVTATIYNYPNSSGYYILVVDGSGSMKSYYSTSMPWYSYRAKIKAVIFGEGVSCVGAYSFYKHTALENISLSKTVSSIGDNAFYGCTSLTSVNIPDGVTDIGYRSFQGCSKISTVSIGKGVTYIDQYAFYGCKYIEKLVFNATDTYVAQWAFNYVGDNSGGVALEIGKNVENFSSWAFDYSSNSITLKSVTFESASAYREMPSRAFYGQVKLTSVTLSDGLTSIGSNAFYGCTSLNAITVPESVNSIGSGAFYGCTSLQTLKVMNSPLSIGDNAFYKCEALSNVSLGNAVTSIGESAFYYCENIISLSIPSTVTSIGSYAFSDCKNLASVNLPNGITEINSYTFRYCYDLKQIVIPESVLNIYNDAFYYCSSLESVELKEGVGYIGTNAFWGCSALKKIVIPDSVYSVAYSAFDYCSSLSEVKVGKGVESLTLNECDSITSVDVSAENPYLKSVDGSLYSKDGTQILIYARGKSDTDFTLPEGVVSVESGAFCGADSLQNVILSKELKEVNSKAFYDCSGLLSVKNFENVEYVGASAFYRCSALESITLGKDVGTVGSSAFYGCTALKYAIIRSPKVAQTITSAASSAGYLGAYARTVVVPTENTYLAEAFAYVCEMVIGGESFVSYSDHEHSWLNSGNLSSCSECAVTKSNPVCEWDISASRDGKLVAVLWENSSNEGEYLLIIDGEGAMADFSSAEKAPWSAYAENILTVSLTDKITTVGDYAFYGLVNLSSLDLPSATASIGRYAFYGCKLISEIEIGENVESIEDGAFDSCTALSKVIVKSSEIATQLASVASCGNILSNADNLLIILESSVPTEIDSVFTSKEELRVDGTYYIAYSKHTHNFVGATCKSCGLKKDVPVLTWNVSASSSYNVYAELWTDPEKTGYYILNVGGSGKMLDYSTSSCAPWYSGYATKISTVNIEKDITYIGSYSFYGCTNLTKINYNASCASSIRQTNYIFYNAGSAADGIEVVIGKNVQSIPANLFYSFNPSYASQQKYIPNVTSVIFEQGSTCKSIGDSAFRYLLFLKTFDIPQSVYYIASYAFFNAGLTEITVPNSITTLGSYTFSYCINLVKAELFCSKVGWSMFEDCTSLSKVTLDDEVKEIDTYAFRNCTSLKSLLVPAGVTVSSNPFYETSLYSSGKINLNDKKYVVYSDHSHSASGGTWTEESREGGVACYRCSTCGVVNEVRYSYASGVCLNLNEDINIVFILDIQESVGFENIQIEFMGETFAVSADEIIQTEDGRYSVRFKKILPQYMGDAATITVVSNFDGWTVESSSEISIRDYCAEMLVSYESDIALITLLSDLLEYGAAAQRYVNYKTDELVTDGLELSPGTYTTPENKISLSGGSDADAEWVAFGLNCSGTINPYVTVKADSVDDLRVVITINDRVVDYPVSYFEKDGNGNYKIYLRGVYAEELDDIITAEFYRGGVRVGKVLTCSVKSYACYVNTDDSTSLASLVRALCNYGTSAKNYAGGDAE